MFELFIKSLFLVTGITITIAFQEMRQRARDTRERVDKAFRDKPYGMCPVCTGRWEPLNSIEGHCRLCVVTGPRNGIDATTTSWPPILMHGFSAPPRISTQVPDGFDRVDKKR